MTIQRRDWNGDLEQRFPCLGGTWSDENDGAADSQRLESLVLSPSDGGRNSEAEEQQLRQTKQRIDIACQSWSVRGSDPEEALCVCWAQLRDELHRLSGT